MDDPDSPSDEVLVELEAVVDAVLRRVFRCFASRLDPDVVEDCRQEVHLALWKHGDTLRALLPHQRAAYARTLVERAAPRFFVKASHTRKRCVQLEGTERLHIALCVSDLHDSVVSLACAGFAGWVEDPGLLEALSTLTPRAYEILDLHYRQHLTFAEIADVLHSKEAAVRKQHNRAIEVLRGRLEGAVAPKRSGGRASEREILVPGPSCHIRDRSEPHV